MSKAMRSIDTVRASRAGHTFHERWAARRALQLVFPKDNLFAIVVEGLYACCLIKYPVCRFQFLFRRRKLFINVIT